MLIFVVTEGIRLYLFNAYELFSFNLGLLVIEKDLSHHDYLDESWICLWTARQITNIRNTFANNTSTDIKLSKAQISKFIQLARLSCSSISDLGTPGKDTVKYIGEKWRYLKWKNLKWRYWWYY